MAYRVSADQNEFAFAVECVRHVIERVEMRVSKNSGYKWKKKRLK